MSERPTVLLLCNQPAFASCAEALQGYPTPEIMTTPVQVVYFANPSIFFPLNLSNGELARRTESCLIIYSEEDSTEALIVDFSQLLATNIGPESAALIQQLVQSLLEQIRGSQHLWDSRYGYQNLRERSSRQTLGNSVFLTVSLREPVRSYIDAHRGVYFVQPVPNPVVRQAMENASNRIQAARLKSMEAIYRGEGQKEDILEEIEQVANQELFDLGQIVQQVVGCSVRLPTWWDEFRNQQVIDDETQKLVETSECVGQYVTQFSDHSAFDYTVVACGLWKAVERVLNLSVVWHVRRTRSLAGPDADRFRKHDPRTTRKALIAAVNLNNSQDDDPARFKGLMLGQLLDILEVPRLNGLSSEMRGITGAKQLLQTIEDKSDLGVYHKLTKMKPIRNEGSHISTLSREKYEEVRSIILGETLSPSLLQMALDIKRIIDLHWKKMDEVPHRN